MQRQTKLFTTRNLTIIALLSTLAAILMQMGIKLPILFPDFLELDWSETPAIIAVLTVHPLAGIVVIIMKNLLKLLIFQTNTGGIGELANMLISIGYILPLTIIALRKRDLKSIVIGIALGTVSVAITGGLVNYFITLPLYAKLFMPVETMVAAGNKIFPLIVDYDTFVLYSIVPFNIFKGVIVGAASVAFVKLIFPTLRYLNASRHATKQ